MMMVIWAFVACTGILMGLAWFLAVLDHAQAMLDGRD